MNRKLVGRIGAVALTAALTSGAVAQSFGDYSKTMAAGATLLLGHVANVNPDCSSRGPIDVRLLNGPSSGTIRVVHRADYSHFTGDFEQCNAVRVSGTSIYYTPAKGFTGSDSVELDMFAPAGIERTATFTITVK